MVRITYLYIDMSFWFSGYVDSFPVFYPSSLLSWMFEHLLVRGCWGGGSREGLVGRGGTGGVRRGS